MALPTHVGSTRATGTTTATAATVAGTAVGDQQVLLVAYKRTTTTPATPAGWTVVHGPTVGGGGTAGAGTGPVGIIAFARTATSAGQAFPAVTHSGTGAVLTVVGTVWRPATGESITWDSAWGQDITGTSTAWSATGSKTLDARADDQCLVFTGFTTNSTIWNVAPTVSTPGTVQAGVTTLVTGSGGTSSGDDMSSSPLAAHIVSGTATGPTTLAGETFQSVGTGTTGQTLFLRMRGEVASAEGPSEGTATGAVTATGAATGAAPAVTARTGSATGVTTTSGAATGQRVTRGAGVGTVATAGAAAGRIVRRGTATGTAGWTGAATGTAPAVAGRTGSATGITAVAGVATGRAPRNGQAAGTVVTAGAATGRRVTRGAGAGLAAWVGAATGARHSQGVAASTNLWTGTATGRSARSGVATVGETATAGTAVGYTPPEGRDIAVTFGPGRSRALAVTAGRGRDLAVAGRTRTMTAQPRGQQ